LDVASRSARLLGLLVLGLLVPLGAGCATRASVRRIHTDVAVLRSELAELREAQAATTRELARQSAEHRALQARSAEVDGALRQAREEIGRLRDRKSTRLNSSHR